MKTLDEIGLNVELMIMEQRLIYMIQQDNLKFTFRLGLLYAIFIPLFILGFTSKILFFYPAIIVFLIYMIYSVYFFKKRKSFNKWNRRALIKKCKELKVPEDIIKETLNKTLIF